MDTPSRITGRRLQARRERYAQRDPLCAHCKARGIIRQWSELDHVTPLHKGGPDTEANLQGLCAECHKAKTREDMGHRLIVGCGPDGWPVR